MTPQSGSILDNIEKTLVQMQKDNKACCQQTQTALATIANTLVAMQQTLVQMLAVLNQIQQDLQPATNEVVGIGIQPKTNP